MENTIENKSIFHAQYWGQKVLCFNDEGQYKPGNCYLVDGSIDDYTFLELKSVKSITDNDSIELIKIKLLSTGINEEEILSVKIETRTLDGFTFIVNYKNWAPSREGFIFNGQTNPSGFYDFLRFKGYAVPYMGLSVEELIKYGWIKIKEHNG